MKLKTYKKNFESLYSHSIEEVEMLLEPMVRLPHAPTR